MNDGNSNKFYAPQPVTVNHLYAPQPVAGTSAPQFRKPTDYPAWDHETITLPQLVEMCGKGAAASGWHDDKPKREDFIYTESHERALTFWRSTKIALMHSELSEALEFLRDGEPVNEVQYTMTDVGDKPDGHPSEIADAVIRLLDYCYTEEIDLADVVAQKLAYNAKRGFKHGGRGF